jgi:hypothetical protein
MADVTKLLSLGFVNVLGNNQLFVLGENLVKVWFCEGVINSVHVGGKIQLREYVLTETENIVDVLMRLSLAKAAIGNVKFHGNHIAEQV